ncbi:multidrug efflux RND transporter permease subunit [Ostreibacterium oceani]|uniref:Efflux pump membrane transporter n=1 Tax=Ostreibacterium oceani TaxID=2654998 RepID=A0A6N7ETV3_9GAMM|nr:multidrug efflux RND transporter permease subunit [Ostreibacterium oceani]MPV85383.1 multidrug efflux RND transporter permease subunit [Ostreibacterium oceani]
MAQFFIDRPRFAWVIALLILIAGYIALTNTAVSAYPNIAPPNVTIQAVYPGAAAKTIEDTVTTVIESEMTGIKGLKYVESTSSRAGTATINLTFETGTDIDLATLAIQNRLKRVEAKLPTPVINQGLQIGSQRRDFLMVIALYSPNGTYNQYDLGDYIDEYILQDIQRLSGVGSAQLFGSTYAMRIWIDPQKMYAFGVTPNDIISAIRAQNAQLATGELGALPAPPGQQINATILVPSQIANVEAFGEVVVLSSDSGATVRIRDIGRVELGAESYATKLILNGQPASAFAVRLSNSGNALATAEAAKAKMAELSAFFPDDMAWIVPYDTSLFVDIAVNEVKLTLIDAILLVTLVIFVFLQSWRSTIIPLIVVPISLLGAVLAIYSFDFSINLLTLFAMVLVIGIVVDDAILVVENTVRIIDQEGLTPYQATKKSLKQITGAVIGTTAVLFAVFIPSAFIPGTTGEIYKQFALTITMSVAISSFLALSLAPAMAQMLLKPKKTTPGVLLRPFVLLGNGFNLVLEKITNGYIWLVRGILTKVGMVFMLLVFAGVLASITILYQKLPKSFLPAEDQGFIVVLGQLPAGATLERTQAFSKQLDDWFLALPEVENTITVNGFSFFGVGQNVMISFIDLKPWDERIANGWRSADELINFANTPQGIWQFSGQGFGFALNLPPIPGLGNTDGFSLNLQNRTNDAALLDAAVGQLLQALSADGRVLGPRVNALAPIPQIQIDIDRDKAQTLGIDIGELNFTLQAALGASYVDDFVDQGRIRQVWVQADSDTRSSINNIMELQIRNRTGGLVKLKEIADYQWVQGPAALNRFNGLSSVAVTGSPAPGLSSGDVLALVEALAAKLPQGISYEWSGTSLEEKTSGNIALVIFVFSLVVAFLALVALYESWSIPVAVILVVPLGVLGAVLAVTWRGYPNDVYFTIGLISIIGLATKNAIVIVEFCLDLQKEGMHLRDAIITACRQRFRPVIMTSMVFILGVMPLVFSEGAGAASRRAIGTGVLGGMLSATTLVILFVPVFYYLIRWLIPAKPNKALMNQPNFSETHET